MLKLDQIIRSDLASDVFLINQISEYIINAGGKRIRPLITILCGRIAGYTEGDLLHKMAAMIEYIHTATLLHDDVVDDSGLRRGRKTSNAVFGNAASVLVGDFIYTRSFQLMIQTNSLRLLEIMATITNKISEGEVLQLLNIGRNNLSEAEYFAVIEHKTAILFEAAARVAAIITQSSISTETALASYAVNLGTAFQIIDDILDYVGDSKHMGKNVGDDLLEGKVTLPLIYSLNNGNKTESEIIKKAIENPNQAQVETIVCILKNNGAIDYCINLAHTYTQKAIAQLDNFKPSIYKEAMINLANQALKRLG
ncbi:MAG: polyprenyl synthetase family protein [Burkholderiales bacterium]|nr:polyprenyl synthetase family protein [Burkholderiales bacterium]